MALESPDHVDDEALVRLACNELDAARTAAVWEHLERCEECAEVWRAVERVREAAVEFDPGAVAPLRFGSRRSPSAATWVGLAAAAVLAAALAFLPNWRDRSEPASEPPVVRSGGQPVPTPVTPAESSRVVRPTFSWLEVEDAAGYSVELTDVDGELLWSGVRIEGNSATWPAAVELRPGLYYWRVSAHFADGEDTLASPLISFEVVAD